MMDESDKYGAPPPTYTDTSSGGQYTETQHTSTTTEHMKLGCHTEYVKSIPGILKIVEMVCSLVCLITSAIVGGAVAGWGGFVAGLCLFLSLVWFFFYLFGLIGKIPPWRLLFEWIYYLVVAICFLIASIACAAVAPAPGGAALGAYAFFGFVCTAALAVDLFLQFRVWRSEGISSTHHTTTTTTTTEVRY